MGATVVGAMVVGVYVWPAVSAVRRSRLPATVGEVVPPAYAGGKAVGADEVGAIETGACDTGARESVGATVVGANEIGAREPVGVIVTGACDAGAREAVGATVTGARETGATDAVGEYVTGAYDTGARDAVGATVVGAIEVGATDDGAVVGLADDGSAVGANVGLPAVTVGAVVGVVVGLADVGAVVGTDVGLPVVTSPDPEASSSPDPESEPEPESADPVSLAFRGSTLSTAVNGDAKVSMSTNARSPSRVTLLALLTPSAMLTSVMIPTKSVVVTESRLTMLMCRLVCKEEEVGFVLDDVLLSMAGRDGLLKSGSERCAFGTDATDSSHTHTPEVTHPEPAQSTVDAG